MLWTCLLPLQVYKLTVDFKDSEIKIITKAIFDHGCSMFVVCDQLITYMIKNIGHSKGL